MFRDFSLWPGCATCRECFVLDQMASIKPFYKLTALRVRFFGSNLQGGCLFIQGLQPLCVVVSCSTHARTMIRSPTNEGNKIRGRKEKPVKTRENR